MVLQENMHPNDLSKVRKINPGDVSASKRQASTEAPVVVLASSSEEETHAQEQQPTLGSVRTALENVQPRKKIKSEMGIIKEIYCENFMCHRKMRVKLGSNVNFITGQNGSGKSAIVAAIQICLGATARTTHRGKSLKGLIRREHPGNALARITLLNDDESADAYRYDLYGDEIVIERIIRRDGSTEYRLKNSEGKLVSKLKRDLEDIVDHMNIQIENPCAVLSQEDAKLFLKGDSKEKYKFFLKSTDLFTMKNKYLKIQEETKTIETNHVEHEHKKLETLQVARDDAEKKYEESKQIGHLEELSQDIRKQLAWSFVKEQEDKRDAEVQRCRAVEEKKNRTEDVVKELKEIVAKLEAKQQTKNTAIQQAQERLSRVELQIDAKRNEMRRKRAPMQQAQSEKKEINKKIKQARNKIARLVEQKERETQEHAEKLKAMAGKNEALMQKIEAREQELERMTLECEQLLTNEEELSAARSSSSEKVQEISNTKIKCERRLHQTQQRISELNQQKNNRVLAFGSKVPELIHLIKQNLRQFSQPPIGPIGMYVKIPEEHKPYTLAIEFILRNQLSNFIVDNGKDKALLDELRRRAQVPKNQCNITIASVNARRHNHLQLPEDPALARHAVCNLIEVTHDAVFNVLVDTLNIENKMIFDTREEAEKATFLGVPGQQTMPRNVREVFIPDGAKMSIRRGNQQFNPNRSYRRAYKLTGDVSDSVREEKRRLEELKSQYQVYQRDERAAQDELRGVDQEYQTAKKSLRSMDHDLSRSKTALKRAKQELSDLTDTEYVDTSVYDDRIRTSEHEIEQDELRLQEIEKLCHQDDGSMDAMVAEIKSLREDKEELENSLGDLDSDIQSVFEHLSDKKSNYMRESKKLEAYQERLGESRQQCAQLDSEVTRSFKKAVDFCGGNDTRVEVRHSKEVYMKQFEDIQQRIEHEKERFQGMNLDDLQMDFEEKDMKYQKKKMEIDAFDANLKNLQDMLHERMLYWGRLRKQISSQTSIAFNERLGDRDFAGKIKYDFQKGTLDLVLLRQEKGANKDSQVTDMKALSGGERSFAQVCLLLALGQSIECPFRVMDEFDVFMDSVNRKMTLEALVQAGLKESSRQFIYVTPNDLSSLSKHPKVKIQKLDPPRE